MTPAEIDQLLDAMAAEARTADESQLPGAIFLHPDTYIGMRLKTECLSLITGIRYRGVRVLVSREFENQVVARGDLQRDVGEFMDLTPPP